jgi:C4-dicarboxylate-binding protein DctP
MLGKALAQGIVDGQDNAWSNIRSQDVYRLQNHITVSKHTYLGYLVVVGAGFWNQLPEYIQQELREILVESVTYSRRLAAAAEQADRAAIADDGQVDILELSPEERALWKKATASVEREFAQKIGESLLEDVHLLINQQN